jgi:hypothetical protein
MQGFAKVKSIEVFNFKKLRGGSHNVLTMLGGVFKVIGNLIASALCN